MANLPETSTFDAGVYQLETTDPAIGGPNGKANASSINLTNRTKYLKDHLDAMETASALWAPINSPIFTGNPRAPTPAQFDEDTSLATTEFVKRALGNNSGTIIYAANATLTAANAGKWIYFGADSILLTLPLATSCDGGTLLCFTANGHSGAQVRGQGSEKINTELSEETIINIGRYDTAIFLNGASSGWFLVGGEAKLKYSSAFFSSIAASGYEYLPSGLIRQWGAASTSNSADVAVSFPIAFPSAVYNVAPSAISISSIGNYVGLNTPTVNGFNINGWANSTTRTVVVARWSAIGS